MRVSVAVGVSVTVGEGVSVGVYDGVNVKVGEGVSVGVSLGNTVDVNVGCAAPVSASAFWVVLSVVAHPINKNAKIDMSIFFIADLPHTIVQVVFYTKYFLQSAVGIDRYYKYACDGDRWLGSGFPPARE